MKKDEKKEWIIRYAKNHELEDVLAEKYKNKKANIIKRHSSEIQAVCSLLSVVIIGVVSSLIAIRGNGLIEAQNRIMKYEQKPVIDISVSNETKKNIEYVIDNRGGNVLKPSVDVIPFINVRCMENGFGYVPIRAYLLPDSGVFEIDECSKYKTDNNIIARITLLKGDSKIVTSLEDRLTDLISEYSDDPWIFSLTYLIRVKSIDVFDEENVDYFIYDILRANRITMEVGDSIYDDCLSVAGDKHFLRPWIQNEKLFNIDNIDAIELFRYSLEIIRDKGLYYIDPDTDQQILYGEYEPKKHIQKNRS